MTRFTLPSPHAGRSVATGLFIAGTWRDAKKIVAVGNPSNGEKITDVADGDASDAIAAVDAAEAVRPGWAATPPRQRAEILRRCFDKMVAAADWLAWLRLPVGSVLQAEAGPEGCRVWIKTGHLLTVQVVSRS